MVIQTFRQRCQELGALTALAEALDALMRRIRRDWGCPRYYLLAQPVHAGPLMPGGRRGRLVIRRLTPGDTALEQIPRTRGQIADRFGRGGICLAAFPPDREEPLGFIWLLFGPWREPEHRCILHPPDSPPCALDIDVYVHSEARGSLVFAQLWQAANELLLSSGIQWSLSRISAFNHRSLRAHERLGAERVGTLQFLQLGGLEIVLATCPPYVSWSRTSSEPPSITVRPPDRRDLQGHHA